MNPRARAALVLLHAATAAAFLASVRAHVLALHGGAPPAFNESAVHNLVARFVALPLPFPLLLPLCAALAWPYFAALARLAASLLPDPARGARHALLSHAPLALLLAHPLLSALRYESLGRKLALAALAGSALLYLAPLLPRLLRRTFAPLPELAAAEARLLRAELARLPGALRRLPGLFLDHQPLVLLTLFAFALRLYRIDERGIWWDEFAAFDWNKGSLADLLRDVARYDSHPPLFYLVERLSFHLFGFTILVSRLPMALLSALSVPAVHLLASRLLAPSAALPAACLAALAPFSVIYGQEARMYGMLLFLLAWAAVCLARAVHDGERLAAWALFALLALALHTHFMALPFALIFPLYPLLLGCRDRFAPVACACAAALGTLLPWALVARASPVSGEFAAYLTHWLAPAPPSAILTAPLFLLDGPFNPHGLAALALLALPALLPLPALLRPGRERRALLGLLLLAWGPILLEYLLSAALHAWSGAAIFQVKHLIGVLPFLILLLARSAQRLPPAPRAAFFACLLLLQAATLMQYFQADLNTNWTAAAGHLAREVRDGDAVVCMPDLALASLQTYYKPAFPSAAPLALRPAPAGESDAAAADRFFAAALSGRSRVHVAVREIGVKHGAHFPRDAALLDRLGRELPLTSAVDFEGTPALRVIRFERGAGGGSAECGIVHRLDLSRLLLYRYAVETGLLDELPAQTMVDRAHEKIPMARGEDGLWRATVRFPRDASPARSFHAVLDTGVKSGFLAHYFYVGESVRFGVTGYDEGREVAHRPATLRDPFVRMGRDAILLALCALSLAAFLAPLPSARSGGTDPEKGPAA